MDNFTFKKKYGQNFLQDTNIVKKIVYSITPEPDDLIIEIGPGGGALTKLLKQYNANILAYEIDLDVKIYLDNLVDSKTQIIYDDFLTRNIMKDIESIKYNNLYIVGNLPYYITTPIITKIIESNLAVKEMVFMVQKEVADRFCALPKTRDYGSITVFLNYYFNLENLFIVNRNCFFPKPNVDSAVIKLMKKEPSIKVENIKFSTFVKDCFKFKRKNLRNNLKQYDLKLIQEILNKHGYSLDNRAEDLPYEVFVDIVNNY